MVCLPQGAPPYPAVVFNHGFVIDKFGLSGAENRAYDLEGICRAVARDGFLGFFPIRSSGLANLRGHLREVRGALAAAKARPDVDPARVALACFSRGGFLTLMEAVRGADVRAFVILAPAPWRGAFQRNLSRVGAVDAPVLAMVEKGDSDEIQRNVDGLEAALRDADKPHLVIRYDRGGGHRLFWRRDYYWPDLIEFLRLHLGV